MSRGASTAVAGGVQGGLERLAAVRVGRVVSYNETTQSCTVQPIPRNPAGELLPVIDRVPVVFPTGAGFALSWPLSAGDTVLLVHADWAIDQWLTSGSEAAPADQRTHDINDAIAIPGLASYNAARANASATAFRIELDGAVVFEVSAAGVVQLGANAGTDFVALAAAVMSELGAIKTAFDAHTHSGVTTGVGFTGIPVAPLPAASSVAATKVKAL